MHARNACGMCNLPAAMLLVAVMQAQHIFDTEHKDQVAETTASIKASKLQEVPFLSDMRKEQQCSTALL